MRIFDTHADILFDLVEKSKKGIHDAFEKMHKPHLDQGDICGGIWVVYSENDFDILEACEIAVRELSRTDYSKYKVVFGLEGLRNVPSIEVFDQLHSLGFKHAGLTWNEENHLACGVKGPHEKGLTSLGKTFLDYMVDHNMIIDLSHLNVKSFFDVLNHTQKNILVSHSNAQKICNSIRNLSDEQIKAVGEVKGLIGVVTARNFVSNKEERQNVEGLVDHIEYIANKIGIDRVCIGFDFMNYLEDYANANITNLEHAGKAQNIIKTMRSRGFNESEIEKVAHLNIEKFIKKVEN